MCVCVFLLRSLCDTMRYVLCLSLYEISVSSLSPSHTHTPLLSPYLPSYPLCFRLHLGAPRSYDLYLISCVFSSLRRPCPTTVSPRLKSQSFRTMKSALCCGIRLWQWPTVFEGEIQMENGTETESERIETLISKTFILTERHTEEENSDSLAKYEL